MNISSSHQMSRASVPANASRSENVPSHPSSNPIDLVFGSINDFFEKSEAKYQQGAEPGRMFAPVRRSFEDAVHFSRMDSAPKNEAGYALGGFGEVINWRHPQTLEFKAGVAEGQFGQPLGPDSLKNFHDSALKFASSIDQTPLDSNPEPGLVGYRQAPSYRYDETSHDGSYDFVADLKENRVAMRTESVDGGPLVFSPNGIARGATLSTQGADGAEITAGFSAENKNGPLLQGNLSYRG